MKQNSKPGWFSRVGVRGRIRRCTGRGVFGDVRLALVSLVCVALSGTSIADSVKSLQPVYGAGPSTEIVKLFFQHFAQQPEAKGIEFSVPERSVKHKGGIRASSQHLFGRTGRPLTAQEKAQRKFEIILGKIPVGFATGAGVKLPPLSPSVIDDLFSGRVSNWKALGGPDAPVELVGREKTEAVLMAMSADFPVLVSANYNRVFKRDHAVVNFLKTTIGQYAIGFGALSNFGDLNRVEIAGLMLGVDVGLVVDKKNAKHPVVEAVRRFSVSAEWHRVVANAGYHPSTDPEADATIGILADER